MTELLIRLFIRDKDNVQDPTVRQQYGTLSGLTGICLNILLFLGKLVAGTVSGSIAITADAFNNLSDAASSIISFIGVKMTYPMPAPRWSRSSASGWLGKNPIGITPSATVG